MPKITFIGAGSTVFAKTLIGDVLSYPELGESTITLFDIDEESLAIGAAMQTLNALSILRGEGKAASGTVAGARDRA